MNIFSKIGRIFRNKYFYIIILTVIAIMSISVYAWDMKRLGKSPSGARLERMKKSPNYKDGQFVNQSPTKMGIDSSNFLKMLYKFFFESKEGREPVGQLPTMKSEINKFRKESDYLVWFGHSSYYFQIDGKSFLIDPVFSTYASPFSFINKAFKGTNLYQPKDFPEIDFLIITHDHWDHLDYESVVGLKDKIKNVICPLGVGEHLEYWGYDSTKILEGDWYEKYKISDGFNINYFPQRHFSGRTFKRYETLWTSYVLETPSMKIFIGGDGGYDKHFAEIGSKFDFIDLAILENGQYNEQWKAIHSLPEHTAQAAIDLKAKKILPVHSSKFILAFHSWKEPLEKISELAERKGLNLITPVIGETVRLKDTTQKFQKWWENIK